MTKAIRAGAAIGLTTLLSLASAGHPSDVTARSLARHRIAERSSLSALPLAAQGHISAALGRDEVSYHATRRADGFRMENPKHALTMELTSGGVELRSGAASWGFTLRDYGYGAELRTSTRTVPQAIANRVEYRRGGLIEWYVNGPLGLEQGMTLAQPPGAPAGEPLTFVFGLSGDLVAAVDPNGKDLTLSEPDGTVALRYRGLMAYDAAGRELPAWLEVDAKRLTIRVDDTGADYPLVVDPFIERATLTASDGAAGDQFGSVAVDGDTIVVGAFLDDVDAIVDQGSAYVFVKPASGWSGPLVEQARLMASDGAMGDTFGLQVAVSGDTIVVGARLDDIGTAVDRGSAYVFVRPPDGWSGTQTQSAKLTAAQGASQDLFGDRVAIDGDTIVVGARFDDIPGGCLLCDPIINRGSAYVFVKPAAGWSGNLTQNAMLNPATTLAGEEFGISVAISAETVVVGAWRTSFDRGAAYVFVEPAGGWSGNLFPNARLNSSDVIAGDLFGVSAGVAGDTIAVGAYRDDTGTTLNHGSVYVFEKPAGGWAGNLTEDAKLTASDGATNDELGNPVAVSGDTIVAGAVLDDVGANADQGSVYVFRRPESGWSGALTESEKLNASDGAASDLFGNSIALQGHTLVVGAPRHDPGSNADQGIVYVFLGNQQPTLILPADVTAEAASAAGAIVTFTADATDPEDGVLTPTCEPATGSTFPLGVTDVTCSVTDAEGAQATGSFTVTVVDTTPPELLLPASTTVEATGPDGAVVTYTAAASDLVDGAITPLCAPESGTRFPLGVTTVTCVATDSHGNGSSGAFTIAVVDTTAPVLTLPSNITTAATGPGGAAVTYSASASDVVDGPITPECAPGSGTIFPIGVTTVTCTASDNAGNAAAGSFTITVQSGTVAFASFSAGAQIVLRPGTNDDLFAVEALVTPGAGADGINPLTEPVTLVLGTGSWTVAPGAFQRGLFGSFVFSGVVGTTQLGVGIQPLQGGRLLLVAVGSGAELTGVANPVSVAVTIGDDTGATTVTARIR